MLQLFKSKFSAQYQLTYHHCPKSKASVFSFVRFHTLFPAQAIHRPQCHFAHDFEAQIDSILKDPFVMSGIGQTKPTLGRQLKHLLLVFAGFYCAVFYAGNFLLFFFLIIGTTLFLCSIFVWFSSVCCKRRCFWQTHHLYCYANCILFAHMPLSKILKSWADVALSRESHVQAVVEITLLLQVSALIS